jgi:hypothetical protein
MRCFASDDADHVCPIRHFVRATFIAFAVDAFSFAGLKPKAARGVVSGCKQTRSLWTNGDMLITRQDMPDMSAFSFCSRHTQIYSASSNLHGASSNT